MPSEQETKKFTALGIVMKALKKHDAIKFEEVFEEIINRHVYKVLFDAGLFPNQVSKDYLEKARADARAALIKAWGIDA